MKSGIRQIRIPSYTTRMMSSFLFLALLATGMGVWGNYRIRGSLVEMQTKFHRNNDQVNRALNLHEAIEKRREAETLFLATGQDRYSKMWKRPISMSQEF